MKTPLSREQHLLIILSEECAEVQHKVSKALRFGLDDHEPEKSITNAEEIAKELGDISGVLAMLVEENILPTISSSHITNKKIKIEMFLNYSKTRGTLK